MENPYHETNNTGVETDDVEQTIITDTTGASVIAEERGTQVVVDANGARHFQTVKRLVRGEGQRIITDPTQTYTCACGSALLTKETVAFCEVCQHPCCRHHIKKADDGLTVTPMCASCFLHGKWQRDLRRIARRTMRFLQWLTNI
jgi:hypothetical protein